MPSLFSRLKPCPGRCPRCWCCRRPRRRRLPPPPEFFPGPAFIVLSDVQTDCKVLQNFRLSRRARHCVQRQNSASHSPLDFSTVAGCDGTHYGTNPKISNEPLFANENFSRYRFSVYRICMAPPRNGWRGRPARERGLNENRFIVLVLALARKAPYRCFLHSRP